MIIIAKLFGSFTEYYKAAGYDHVQMQKIAYKAEHEALIAECITALDIATNHGMKYISMLDFTQYCVDNNLVKSEGSRFSHGGNFNHDAIGHMFKSWPAFYDAAGFDYEKLSRNYYEPIDRESLEYAIKEMPKETEPQVLTKTVYNIIAKSLKEKYPSKKGYFQRGETFINRYHVKNFEDVLDHFGLQEYAKKTISDEDIFEDLSKCRSELKKDKFCSIDYINWDHKYNYHDIIRNRIATHDSLRKKVEELGLILSEPCHHKKTSTASNTKKLYSFTNEELQNDMKDVAINVRKTNPTLSEYRKNGKFSITAETLKKVQSSASYRKCFNCLDREEPYYKTISDLVYAIAQKTLKEPEKKQNETIKFKKIV